MPFGVRDTDLQVGYAPRVDGGNVPVSLPPSTDFGLSNLAESLSAGNAARNKARRDMAMGEDFADALGEINKLPMDNPADRIRKLNEFTGNIGRKYGAPAMSAFQNLYKDSLNSGLKTEWNPATKSFVISNTEGNVLGEWNSQDMVSNDGKINNLSQTIDPSHAANEILQEEITNTAVNAPKFSEYANQLMGGLQLPVGDANRQHIYDISNRTNGMFSTLMDNYQTAKFHGQNVPSMSAFKDMQADLKSRSVGAIVSNFTSIVSNPLLVAAMQSGKNTGMYPELAVGLLQNLKSDTMAFLAQNNGDVAASMGINMQELDGQLQTIIDKSREVYTAHFKGENEVLNGVQTELKLIEDTQRSAIWNRLPDDVKTNVVTLTEVGKYAPALSEMFRMATADRAPKDMLPFIGVMALPALGMASEMWKTFSASKAHFADAANLNIFVDGVNRMIRTNPALLYEIVPWVMENKQQFENLREDGADIDNIFNAIPELDAMLDKGSSLYGKSKEEMRALINGAPDISRALLGGK